MFTANIRIEEVKERRVERDLAVKADFFPLMFRPQQN